MMEKDYVGLSEACSAAFNDDEREDEREEEEEKDEEELELGLSLGAKKVSFGGGRPYSYRILTAKDFPAALGSRASPLSSSSSVSSSSSSDGAERVGDSAGPDGSGSVNPPSQVVGWPPIRAFRINSLVNQAKDNNSDADAIASKKNNSIRTECISTKNQEKKAGIINVGITRFVKVNMDGDPIGRKVDLSAHHSYETLALALEAMFHKPTTGLSSSAHNAKASKLLDGFSEFALTYEDKDGDWMLVGDVPWGMFLDTVKRLRFMRTSDANDGLAPRFQSSTGRLLRSKVG